MAKVNRVEYMPEAPQAATAQSLIGGSVGEQIKRLIRKGYSNEQIADKLFTGNKYTTAKLYYNEQGKQTTEWAKATAVDYDHEHYTTDYSNFLQFVTDIRNERKADRSSKSANVVCDQQLITKIK